MQGNCTWAVYNGFPTCSGSDKILAQSKWLGSVDEVIGNKKQQGDRPWELHVGISFNFLAEHRLYIFYQDHQRGY